LVVHRWRNLWGRQAAPGGDEIVGAASAPSCSDEAGVEQQAGSCLSRVHLSLFGVGVTNDSAKFVLAWVNPSIVCKLVFRVQPSRLLNSGFAALHLVLQNQAELESQ
jgi:hypothetical protein